MIRYVLPLLLLVGCSKEDGPRPISRKDFVPVTLTHEQDHESTHRHLSAIYDKLEDHRMDISDTKDDISEARKEMRELKQSIDRWQLRNHVEIEGLPK